MLSKAAIASVLLIFVGTGSVRAQVVPPLSAPRLEGLLNTYGGAVRDCAARHQSAAYVINVRATVRPGARPSTLHNARTRISAVSRPMSPELSRCVQRTLRDRLRFETPHTVERTIRAQITFALPGRSEPAVRRPPPPYSELGFRRLVRAYGTQLSRCLELGGVPASATLRLTMLPDGRVQLTSADLPPGAGANASPCLNRVVAQMRSRARPVRPVRITERVWARRH